jgi:hypothetical protein
MKIKYRYFIQLGDEPEREVSEETYGQAMGTHTTRSILTPDGIARGRVKAEVEE